MLIRWRTMRSLTRTVRPPQPQAPPPAVGLHPLGSRIYECVPRGRASDLRSVLKQKLTKTYQFSSVNLIVLLDPRGALPAIETVQDTCTVGIHGRAAQGGLHGNRRSWPLHVRPSRASPGARKPLQRLIDLHQVKSRWHERYRRRPGQ